MSTRRRGPRPVAGPKAARAVPGNNLTSGEHKGQDAVFAMYGQLFELSDGTVQVDVQDVTAQGDDKVVANHRSQATRNGTSLDVIQTLEFTIADGKITRIDETSGDLAAEDAFWV